MSFENILYDRHYFWHGLIVSTSSKKGTILIIKVGLEKIEKDIGQDGAGPERIPFLSILRNSLLIPEGQGTS